MSSTTKKMKSTVHATTQNDSVGKGSPDNIFEVRNIKVKVLVVHGIHDGFLQQPSRRRRKKASE